MSAEEISVYFGIFAVLAAGAWALYRHFSEKPGGGVEVDVNAIVVRLEEAARREGSLTAQLDESLQREEGLGKQLREAVQAVADQRDSPDAPPGIDDALSLLAEGRTGAAEAVLREVKERRKAEGAEALKEAAAAARHIGALAFLHDTEKALAAYREAVDLDPDDPDGWKFLGNLLNRTGDIDGAIKACNHVLALGNRVDAQAVIADATSNLGILYSTLGDLDRAEAMYEKSLALNEELGRKEGMAKQYGNLGNLYKTRGDLDRAEEMYGKSLTLFRQVGVAPKIKQVEEWLADLRRSD